jgi:hypothetical protein
MKPRSSGLPLHVGQVAHSAERWTKAVVAAIESPNDPRTIEAWGRVAAAATGTLRSWCRAARLPAKKSLDFARLLRAVVRSQGASWAPHNLLNVVDQRTLGRLLVRGGLDRYPIDGEPPDWEGFLAQQRLINDPVAIATIAEVLSRSSADEGSSRTNSLRTVKEQPSPQGRAVPHSWRSRRAMS